MNVIVGRDTTTKTKRFAQFAQFDPTRIAPKIMQQNETTNDLLDSFDAPFAPEHDDDNDEDNNDDDNDEGGAMETTRR